MFRLANQDEPEGYFKEEKYAYISSAISKTIVDGIDNYTQNAGRFVEFLFRYFDETISEYPFFSGAGAIWGTNDATWISADQAFGYMFVLLKMKRMKEKMLDKEDAYTLDVFEEKILYSMCIDKKEEKRISPETKESIRIAENTLRTKWNLRAREAKDYAQKMYLLSKMPLRDEEDANLIFWDEDFDIFFEKGLIYGVNMLEGYTGETRGYGYEYAREIFTDIGLDFPTEVFRTEEENKKENERQMEAVIKWQEAFFKEIIGKDDQDHSASTGEESNSANAKE
ncbi:MAG: hypothetical protein IKZ82_06015 [Clostridia bacterium]|nr:hypothetical protein [Clostridia bacterium]